MGLISSFLLPLSVGARIISLDAFEWVGRPALLLEVMQRHRATHTWMPNFAFNHLARTRPRGIRYDLSSMRAFISCSEPCKPEAFARFLTAFGQDGVADATLQSCYAMAETVFAVTQSSIGTSPHILHVDGSVLDRLERVDVVGPSVPGARGFVSNGGPMKGLEVRVSVPAGPVLLEAESCSGFAGEISVRGSYVFSGYFRNADATADAFDGEWYRTGDIGFIHDGALYICGRRKEILIVHGRNYYATDIEDAVGLATGVKPGRAVAFSIFDERTQSEEAVIVAETEMTDPAALADLRRAVKQAVFDRLELTPQRVELVGPGWLVKTTSGKVSRYDNLVRYLEHSNG
jgi:acyl-CoA synthetase (AMP-forming)/AMP-acid ligase II